MKVKNRTSIAMKLSKWSQIQIKLTIKTTSTYIKERNPLV